MLGELLNKINQLRTDYTTAKAAFLDATISSRAPSSTAVSSADLTPTRIGKLDNLDALVSTAGAKPPIQLSGIPTTVTRAYDSNLDFIASVSASTSTFDTWATILEETAAEGFIQFMNVYQVANASNLNAQARLSIDGTVVWTSASNFWDDAVDNERGACLVGAYNDVVNALAFGAIRFTASFKLEFKKTENAAGTVELATACKYYLTG